MTNKKAKPLSWDPVRHGDIYCSSACGGNCTWAAYQEAHKKAKALVLMLGKGWVPEVWENLGWHWVAKTVDGLMKVHPSIHKGKTIEYTAFFGEGVGGQWTGRDKDPIAAVDLALAQVTQHVRKVDQLLATYQLTVSD